MASGLPYVLLSCAMSLDGYVDDATGQRLLLSNEIDFDRVDEARSGCDAILVGGGTIRADDPRLMVRSPARRADRQNRGLPASPMKVAITAGGGLDPGARFFTTGEVDKVVYVASAAVASASGVLGPVATVVDAGEPIDLTRVLQDLAGRGVRRLMVEGGNQVNTRFLASALVDELRLAMAPFFVGDSRAPRFVGDGRFPYTGDRRARLVEAGALGDVAVLRYALSDRCVAGSP